jgi:hypothetical protein
MGQQSLDEYVPSAPEINHHNNRYNNVNVGIAANFFSASVYKYQIVHVGCFWSDSEA